VLGCIGRVGNNLDKTWVGDRDKSFWLSRSAWSLYLIVQLKCWSNTKVTVWLPSYYCNESIALLRELDVELRFYPVLLDTTPDSVELEKNWSVGSADIIVVVHYFGIPANITRVYELCKKFKVWLVEDAAHVLKPIEGVGEYGDFVIYSPHKILSIPDGAVLILRESGASKITNEYLIENRFYELYDLLLESSNKFHLSEWLWLIKRVLQKIGVSSVKRDTHRFSSDPFVMSADGFVSPRMSRLAKRLLVGSLHNIDEIAALRRANFNRWKEYLSDVEVLNKSFVPMSLKNQMTPYAFICRFNNKSDAKKAYQLIKQLNIPVTTWPDLPPEVFDNQEKYKDSITLRNTQVFLPVHQTINFDSMINDLINTDV